MPEITVFTARLRLIYPLKPLGVILKTLDQLSLMHFFVVTYQTCDSVTDDLICPPAIMTSCSFVTSPRPFCLLDLLDGSLRYSTVAFFEVLLVV